MLIRLQKTLREPLRPTINDETKYLMAFDSFEILAALAFAHVDPYYRGWFPLGLYVWRFDNRRRIVSKIEESIKMHSETSAFVASGLFGDTAEECLQMIKDFNKHVAEAGHMMGAYG